MNGAALKAQPAIQEPLSDSTPRRLFHCVLYVPPQDKPCLDGVPSDDVTGLDSSHRHRHSFAIVNNVSVISSIVLLFLHSGPAYIFRLIVSIVVNAINGMLCSWPSAYVIKKSLVALAPFSTHRDSSAAISIKSFILNVLAPTNHCRPNLIFRLAPRMFAARMAMGPPKSIMLHFVMKASAACRVAGRKGVDSCNGLLTAIAFAQVLSSYRTTRISPRFRLFEYGKTPKFLSNKINACSHA